jgi:hypothetical protein
MGRDTTGKRKLGCKHGALPTALQLSKYSDTRIGPLNGLLQKTTLPSAMQTRVSLAFDSFENVRLWQDIALSLLKKYTERYYTFRKREWELPHL